MAQATPLEGRIRQHREGGKIYIIYPKCYCSQINKIPKGKFSGTYCNCSRGWAKALFEGSMGRPVKVVLVKSIINGDGQYKFRHSKEAIIFAKVLRRPHTSKAVHELISTQCSISWLSQPESSERTA